MQVEAKIGESPELFVAWNPQMDLEGVSDNQVLFGRGFCCLDATKLTIGMEDYWIPLLEGLGAEIRIVASRIVDQFPSSGFKVFRCLINGEMSVIGVESRAYEILPGVVLGEHDGIAHKVVFEYLLRRFYATVSESWRGQSKLAVEYVDTSASSEVDVAGVVELELLVRHEVCRVYWGIGPRVVSYIDKEWGRMLTLSDACAKLLGDAKTAVITVEVAEVLPGDVKVEDLLNTKDIVVFDVPLSNRVVVSLNEIPIGVGTLRQYDGNYVLCVGHIQKKVRLIPPDIRRVTIEIGGVEVPTSELKHYLQSGAVVPLPTRLTDTVSLCVGGEHCRDVQIGVVEGQLSASFV